MSMFRSFKVESKSLSVQLHASLASPDCLTTASKYATNARPWRDSTPASCAAKPYCASNRDFCAAGSSPSSARARSKVAASTVTGTRSGSGK
jgi:hypothetical protein